MVIPADTGYLPTQTLPFASSVSKHGSKSPVQHAGQIDIQRVDLVIHRPILTPKTVLPIFFVIGIIFAPIGGLLLYASAQVREKLSVLSDNVKWSDMFCRCKN